MIERGGAGHRYGVADSEWLQDRLMEDTSFVVNLTQECIVIPEDRVRVILTEHLESLEARQNWVAPASVLATILITLSTADFHEFWTLTATEWKAIFIVSAVVVAIWGLKAGLKAWEAPELDDVIDEMKRVSAESSS